MASACLRALRILYLRLRGLRAASERGEQVVEDRTNWRRERAFAVFPAMRADVGVA